MRGECPPGGCPFPVGVGTIGLGAAGIGMDQLIGHYRVLRKLGEGGMGEVFLARDERLGREVALKLLSLGPGQDVKARQRFLGEARAASALSHPNVCVIHDTGESEDGRPYIAMEYVSGQTLSERLSQGPLAVKEAADIALQIADALEAAHTKGIIHRDIKPANVCLAERNRVKVLDFGLAKRLEVEAGAHADSALTQSGIVLGSPAYMSPEQALGRSLDHRTDIFSLGVVLYELLAGRPPFQAAGFAEMINRIVHSQPDALARFNYDVTPELERIVRKCLEKNPDRRYQSAGELRLDLESAGQEIGGLPSQSGSSTASADLVGAATARFQGGAEAGPSPNAALRPESSPAELNDTDVFISYSDADDQPLYRGGAGWISQFQRHLEVRLRQLSGDEVKIFRPAAQSRRQPPEPRLLELLPQARAMLTVVSPPFARSQTCRTEVQAFIEGRAKPERGSDTSRLLKVVKTPVPASELGELAQIFQGLLGYEFFEVDPNTGRIREFDEVFGEEARQRYYERVYDLAYEIHRVLKLEGAPAVSAEVSPVRRGDSGRTVYLALTTSDLQPEFDAIRRELLEQGCRVVPDKPLPMVLGELEETVSRYLAESDFVVQLVGRNYGLVPENARQSVLELQAEWAAFDARERGLRRYLWLPPGLEPVDDRQAAFIRRLRERDAAEPRTELVEGPLTSFKELVARAVTRHESEDGQAGVKDSSGPPQVYLICDQEDEEAVEAVEDYLFERGLEVCLPDYGSDDDAMGKLHRELLRDCDAVLIYFGKARKAWVDIKLRDLLKANGYGRLKPFLAQTVYIAPPDDRRKERFRSHLATSIIRQEGVSFAPSPELESFVAQVKSGR